MISLPPRRRDPRPSSSAASALTRRRWARAVAAVVAVGTALGTASCSLLPGSEPVPAATPVAAGSSPAPVPEGLEDFYTQDLDWHSCGKGDSVAQADGAYECATVMVPLDYDQPEGTTIQVALKKRPATREAIGTLLVNPGGPGGSGVELVDSVDGYFSSALLDAYDVVGFDPRGVGASTAVDCLTDAERDAYRAGTGEDDLTDLDPEQARAQVVAQARDLASRCAAHTEVAGLLDHIDTVSAARDLDVVRAAVGDERLTYLGYSYGTYLGATYADLFPGNVGRMVLDGAIDPELTSGELAEGQAKGFESALRTYVAQCLDGDGCPLSGSVDEGVTQVQDFLARAATSPVPTSDPDRPLTGDLATSAVIGVLYQDESWPTLTQGLNQAMLQNDGSVLLYIADVFASRNSDGTYSGNGDEVINAINCLDYPVTGDTQQWDDQAARLEQDAPSFGASLAYADLYCQAWGHPSHREHRPISAQGSPTILVVGTTGDPATPYEWSQALASQLADARLVTWEGNGHTAYGRSDGCVTQAVDSYLLAGTVPEEDLVCSAS